MPGCPPAAKPCFLNAIRLPPDQWPAYLDAHCGGDRDLRGWVEGLLAAHAEAGAQAPASADETAAFRPDRRAPAGPEPGTAIGPYVLREPLGEGGMGLVFVAEQTAPVRRKVAVKVIKPGMDTRQVVARFEAERQALAMMDHPNIARVLDAGAMPDGRPYFVMELVKGVPVTTFCDDLRRTVRHRLDLFLQVCAAVRHAHQKGVIHRDLKPSNVLVAVHDVDAVVKVIDFGIAKAVGPSLTDKTVYTGVAQMVGTPLYMSPEQAGQSSLDVDTRSDVYSLGVLLYELLTGTTPIDPAAAKGAAYDDLRRMIREAEPARPSARLSTLNAAAQSTVADRRAAEPGPLLRQVRGELDWVVMKCLEKDRNRRYESVAALADDVRRFLADEPVVARPASVTYRLRKFVRRNRARATAASLALALFAVAATAVWRGAYARVAEDRRVTVEAGTALAAGRAAVDAGDLTAAAVHAAEARSLLALVPGRFADLELAVGRLTAEVDGRRGDTDRYRQFLELAADAQDRMGFAEQRGGHAVAERALGLYGILTDDNWVARVSASRLRDSQKEHIRDEAYVTLVSLADAYVRWKNLLGDDERSARRSLDLLARAAAFHEPTRAFYFVRARCRKLVRDPAAAEDDARYRAMPGRTAWDLYLPGHTAGWEGDLAEAVRSYEAALRIQPDHFNSLFFLGERLGKDKLNRRAEAVQVLRACTALRPTHVWAYTTRAELLERLGRPDEALTDLTAAADRAANEYDRFTARFRRIELYDRIGKSVAARDDRLAFVATAQSFVNKEVESPRRNDHELLILQNNLAVTYLQLGQNADAVPILESLLTLSAAVRGPNHKETFTVIANLGMVYTGLNRHEDAIRLLEPAVERQEESRGKAHRDSLFLNCRLGNAYREGGRYAEAVRVLDPLVRAHETALGPDDPQTLWATESLASALDRSGDPAGALRIYEPLAPRANAVLGSNHPETLRILNDLGVAYLAAKRPADAIRPLETVLERRRATVGPDDAGTLASLSNLASAYGDSGNWDKAESLWEDVLSRRRRIDGPCSVVVASALAGYGQGMLNRRRYAQAEPILRECLAIREQVLPDDWLRFHTLSLLGGALLGQKKYGEAESLLIVGYEGLKERAAAIPPFARVRFDEAAERLAELYDATGRPAEAKRVWAGHRTTNNPPTSPVGAR
jgi:serine/threonine protein kinase/tetratricopeptide (TPR) repeat protein